MFIQIAPKVKVYITTTQMSFITKYKNYESFKNTDLLPEEVEIAKILGDKSIFVRKKLDDGTQYALNRRIKFVKNDQKKYT